MAVPFAAFPFPSFAQTNTCAANFNNFGDIMVYAGCLLNKTVVPLLITIALVMFFIGVIRFIANANDPAKRKEGREAMLWGIVALFVMLSIFGILSVLTNTFGLTTFALPQFTP